MSPQLRFVGTSFSFVLCLDYRRVRTDENGKRRRVLHAEIAHPFHLWFCIFDGTPCRRPAGSLGATLVELLVEREEALHVLRARRAPLAGETVGQATQRHGLANLGGLAGDGAFHRPADEAGILHSTEQPRLGKEGVSTCRYRWWP